MAVGTTSEGKRSRPSRSDPISLSGGLFNAGTLNLTNSTTLRNRAIGGVRAFVDTLSDPHGFRGGGERGRSASIRPIRKRKLLHVRRRLDYRRRSRLARSSHPGPRCEHGSLITGNGSFRASNSIFGQGVPNNFDGTVVSGPNDISSDSTGIFPESAARIRSADRHSIDISGRCS